MSRFISKKYSSLTPYTPGEQPKKNDYVKLNTNESPFALPEDIMAKAFENTRKLNLYSDPECTEIRQLLAAQYGVKPENVIVNNGSDETLNFAFMAFCDDGHPAVFPDITYGFYPVFAALNHVPYREAPLKDDFSLDLEDYIGTKEVCFIANPNAPTGKFLDTREIEKIICSNPDRMVIVDEAYIDFGGESCVPLTKKYKNLLVVQTFSKSRSLAGGRLGFGIACEEIIADLNTIRYSTNPYNVNSFTLAAGCEVLKNQKIFDENCAVIAANRAYTTEKLEELGFEVLPSKANFVFARSRKLGGEELYGKLKEKGVLVRHFTLPRIADYNRITIGTREQMDILFEKIKEILEDEKS